VRFWASSISALVVTATFASAAKAGPDAPWNRRSVQKSVRMLATAYCDRGPTKSGIPAQPGVVAADIRQLPIGTRLRVVAPGQSYDGVYTVLDTGSAIKGRDLDIFMTSCSRAKRFGKRSVQVRVLPPSR